jgi:hypothetical protein
MSYKISKYGNIIKVDDEIVLIPMEETSLLYQEYLEYLKNNGEVLQSDLFTEEEVILINRNNIPETPLWRIRVILRIMNLEENIEASLDLLEEPQKTAAKYIWEYGTVIERNSPTILFIQSSLGLKDLEVDNIFIEANKIVI